jgi:hypothetical protein
MNVYRDLCHEKTSMGPRQLSAALDNKLVVKSTTPLPREGHIIVVEQTDISIGHYASPILSHGYSAPTSMPGGRDSSWTLDRSLVGR